jgi:hypothetical protein
MIDISGKDQARSIGVFLKITISTFIDAPKTEVEYRISAGYRSYGAGAAFKEVPLFVDDKYSFGSFVIFSYSPAAIFRKKLLQVGNLTALSFGEGLQKSRGQRGMPDRLLYIYPSGIE